MPVVFAQQVLRSPVLLTPANCVKYKIVLLKVQFFSLAPLNKIPLWKKLPMDHSTTIINEFNKNNFHDISLPGLISKTRQRCCI